MGHTAVSATFSVHSISNAILTLIFGLITLLKFDLVFLKDKFNLPSAKQFNT